ncbi:acyl-CoA synthetase [Nocardia gamkensis]|uniref:Acyl-CoA synthetase n=2 Tax=Nocardia gamkensis TaxID=352869 RepID=A0A7X6L9V4_9NOCA|nr:acyl-CoA synthetase [Nocardia gamkensis]
MIRTIRSSLTHTVDHTHYLTALLRSGMIQPTTPARIGRSVAAIRSYGMLGGVIGTAAARFPDRAALVDERGTLSFRDLDRRSNAIAHGWRDIGLRPGESVGVLARNHRGFLDAVFAAAKCGARIVLLNTEFAAPQLHEVTHREQIDLLVHDDESSSLLNDLVPVRGRWRTWTDTPDHDTLDALINHGNTSPPPAPGVTPRIILLTSGTTGTPKGAARPEPRSLAPIGALLDRVPFRAGETTTLCPPLFHTLGFAHMMLAVTLGSTLIIRRRFDPHTVIDSLEHTRSTALIVVPIMLARIIENHRQREVRSDLSALRIVYVAGSSLGPDLATRAQRTLGPVLYNMYGSTEVAYATIATPHDLADQPSCVGKPVRGVQIQILDDHGRPTPNGETGRIFVGNPYQSEGYTGGGHKDIISGLMASGDVGHFDTAGRLFIDGRDDDMIVSGGENVFPQEIADLLIAHPAIREACCLGVPDDTYGHRIRAFVVLTEPGTLTADDIRDHVKANLARYKVPRDVVFLDALPRNATGKVLERVLRGTLPSDHRIQTVLLRTPPRDL